MIQNWPQPKYRYALRARIHQAGYRSLTEFSRELGVNVSRISRICSGWELPSRALSRKIAEELGMTMRELKDVL